MNQNSCCAAISVLDRGNELMVPCLQHDVHKPGHIRIPVVNDKFIITVYDKSKVNKAGKSIA